MNITSLTKHYYVDDQRSNAHTEECLFDACLVLYPQNMQCRAQINRQTLVLSHSDSVLVSLRLNDVLNCRVVGSIKHDGEETACVALNAMVRASASRLPSDAARRKLEQLVHFTGADCVQAAQRFCLALQTTRPSAITKVKPLLLVVNPKSGSGRSVDTFESEVKPVLEASGIAYEMLITKHCGHAKQHIETCNLQHYSGIVMVGGDGIIFEVVNALLSRADWQTARKLPIGVLPGGSGNALATAVAYVAGESYRHNLLPSTLYVLCKHQVLPLDLLLFQTSKRFLFGFLEFSWGYVADVDIESESLRALGGLRFQLYGIHRILFKRTRRARLTYLPYEEGECERERERERDSGGEVTERYKFRYLPPLGEPFATDDKRWKTLETNFFNITIQNRPFLTSDSYMYPELDRFDPGYMIALIMHDGIPRLHVLKQLLAEGIVQSPYIETIRMKAFRFEPLDDAPSLIVVDGERIEFGPIQAEILPHAGRVLGIMKNSSSREE